MDSQLAGKHDRRDGPSARDGRWLRNWRKARLSGLCGGRLLSVRDGCADTLSRLLPSDRGSARVRRRAWLFWFEERRRTATCGLTYASHVDTLTGTFRGAAVSAEAVVDNSFLLGRAWRDAVAIACVPEARVDARDGVPINAFIVAPAAVSRSDRSAFGAVGAR